MEEARMKDGGGRIPIQMLAIANLCNQLLRAGISIGANNAEATNAISKADFKSKSFIALKEARESLYWLQLLHRNKYIDDCQHESLYADCEELVKILVHRCKKLNDNDKTNLDVFHLTSYITNCRWIRGRPLVPRSKTSWNSLSGSFSQKRGGIC